ncbi:BA14K family protein [Allorhizobium taibaishanense]|uniref:Lectin-like protein BA14k n=1 Tax=Allorhizobium taibaishanense TaxID=887144 RepID=A0A1Q9A8B0_9HYPH|nr:BA14K family protein [Allorhizobium taibaishanense]MBB4009666.1 hypothetical protein [Allorhizobium taibaishanense]OLP50823.1 hypothetical protein BJF91_06120 [Allorhizobium taibaishanense]
MPFFRNTLMGVALSVAGLMPSLASAAMPRPAEPSATAASEIVDIRYVCDSYGCYDRPDYGRPPPPPPPPGYYRPAPPPPPPGYYRPAPPPPPGWGRHVRWCMDRHRAYNPDTNRFIGGDGRPHVCRSPFY